MQSIGSTQRWINPINRLGQSSTFRSQIISVLNLPGIFFQTNITNQSGLTGSISLEACCDAIADAPGTFSPYVVATPFVIAGNGAYIWDIPKTSAPYFRVIVTITAGSADFDILTFMKI